jgi:hypothetical protein
VSVNTQVLTCIRRSAEPFQEEGEYEYASYKQHSESGTEEHQLGSGVLYQPLGGEGASDGTTSSTVPLCEAVVQGPCARSVPDDHSPNVQSECNRTGQHCSGHRGGGRSRNEGLRNACEMVGIGISIAGFPEDIPAIAAKIMSGGGAAAAAACRAIG